MISVRMVVDTMISDSFHKASGSQSLLSCSAQRGTSSVLPSPGTAAPTALRGMTTTDHLLTLVSVAAPTVLLVTCFSVTGFGDVTYRNLHSWEWPWWAAAGVDAALLLVLWMLDAPRWTRPSFVVVRRLCVLLLVLFAGIACSLATNVYPFAPLQFALLAIPASCFAARRLLLPLPASQTYLASVSASLTSTAVLLAIYFVLWITALPPPRSRLSTGWDPAWVNIWGGEVKQYWRERLHCVPYNASAVDNDPACFDAAFMWWFFPVLIVLSLLVFSLACFFLSRMLASRAAKDTDAFAVKIFVGTIAVAGLGMYVAASISSAGTGLSDLVVVLMLYLVLSALIVVGSTLGWAQFAEAMSETPWVQRALTYMESGQEWCIALFICVGILPLCVYLLLSAGKQATRRARGSSKAAAGGLLTTEAHLLLRPLTQAHWGSVCSKVALLGMVYLVLAVIVAKAVVVFLSGLNALLEPVPLRSVLLIFVLVGVGIFLIPIIPGFPVYVCSGVLIPHAVLRDEERAQLADSTSASVPPSFWAGLLLAALVACLLKFIAIVIQQEVIGRRLGRHVEVRAACGLNSALIRAARFVLTQPGCSVGKTIILCGGPDWPTSVLTGMMKLSCPKMLFGSIPVILLILPATFLGGCLTMANKPRWDAVASLMTILVAGSQMGASVGFAAVIERAANVHAHEIAALPLDSEVAALDDAREAYTRAWRAASDWHRAAYPMTLQVLVVAAAGTMVFSCHLVVLLRCFERVAVSDPFYGPPIHGNPLRVIHEAQGWVVIACFVAGAVLLLASSMWLGKRTRVLLQEKEWRVNSSTFEPPTAAVEGNALGTELGGLDRRRGDSGRCAGM
eukprot:CAMPEP_0119361180 /NCGR_PEP_ID=MMETSP1334-20130426/8554_1 /TAXON_ID=127549 /ORGANISM="Calcidiscus leptoporus, Strain RCC1130" /LENGTH=849 /DNA_ID=CAMNT_0007376127 /DNA_START=40 /DNA_END=2589 /DNA_ORIENTATION=-